jgi:Flp pilus assembly protein TadG
VEFALVVPIFVLLVMGIIDFGMAFNDYNSVRQGVREGARQIVVADWDTDGCTTGTSSARAACVTRARIGLSTADTKVKIVLPEDYTPGDQVKVCAMYPFRSLTGLFSAILNGSAKSKLSMRIEQIDDDAPLTAYQDTAPTGESWSWC